MRKRSAVLLTFLLAATAAGCGGSHKAEADSPENIPSAAVVKVSRHNLSSNLEIASDFQPYQEIEVYAKVSGYIQKLYVDWGTHVKQGQLLAVLEIPELEEQLQQDEAAVRRSEQELARAREEVSQAESAYSVAHLTYTRLADVQKSRPELVAQQEIDVAEGKDLEASAGLSAAKDALEAASQGLLAAKANLEKSRAMYAYARISAPFDGVVTEIYAYQGALLPAGTSSNKGDLALCHLSQNSLLRLVIPLPERAVSEVRLGQAVQVHVAVNNETFPGTIVRLSDQIDTQTRTMHTEVHVPNPKYELVPGMYASVEIPLHRVQNVLAVPVQAVQVTGEGRGAVLVVNGSHRLEKKEVVIGLETAKEVEIVSGLQENDLILFGEQAEFKPGELVNPKIISAPQME